MRLVNFLLLIVVGAGVTKFAASESVLAQRSAEIVTREEQSSNSPPKISIPSSTDGAQPGTGTPTAALPIQQRTGTSPKLQPQNEVENPTTIRAPVYIPLKEKEARTTTPKPNVKVSNTRKDTNVAKPSPSNALKKVAEDQVLQKTSPEKKNDATELAERKDEVAENKEGFFSAVNVPLAASIGAAIMFGGLAYYMQSEPEPISARQGIPPHLGYDHGVRIVRPSDLTPAELNRLVNAGSYHVSGRSLTHSEHPYFDYAKKVYKYVMPEILGGSSKEDEAEERIYIVRHHHHQKNEHEQELEKANNDADGSASPKKEDLLASPTPTYDHPYNRIVNKSLPKI